jgi:cytochrome P450
MEAMLVLAVLAREFRVDVLAHPPPVPTPSVTLRPKHGVHARIMARSRRAPGR